jgi:C4-dicarboxylate-specific signal transduction histidine kinase
MPHSTEAKARGPEDHESFADFEQQFIACRWEVARAYERLIEAVQQQTATAKMPRIIANSPIESTLRVVVENAARLCDAASAAIIRVQEVEKSLKTLQAEFAHVSRVTTLGQLTASIAHEVTQPLAAARNNARAALNFLDNDPPDLGDVREALDCIVGDADRAGNIIDRIRNYIKKIPPQKERFDLNEAINEVIVLARGTIAKNGVLVETPFSECLLHVDGDRVQVQQVVLNLILNAIEAMGSVQEGRRELAISTAQSQARNVRVAIRDSGPGVDPENLERVFDAFYTTKATGVGIGLAICRSIIDAHGGRLWVDGGEPRGAVFQFTLPSAGGDL